jgi:hypothetical protein
LPQPGDFDAPDGNTANMYGKVNFGILWDIAATWKRTMVTRVTLPLVQRRAVCALTLSSMLFLSACATATTSAKTGATNAVRLPAAAPTKVDAPVLPAQNNQFPLLMRWFTGEFDNNEQVWQQKEDAQKTATGIPAEPIEHIHHIFSPIKNPAIGANLLFVKQTLDNDTSKIYRQRMYRLTDQAEKGIQLEIFSFIDEKKFQMLEKSPALGASLTMADLKSTPGCEVFWKYQQSGANANSFTGTMIKNGCKIISRSTGAPIYISDTLKLSESELWISDLATDANGKVVWGRTDGKSHVNRKVRYFTGWAAISRTLKGGLPSGKYSYQSGIVMHNEGGKVPLLFDDGKATGYSIELAQLTYQETKTPILKLALIDDATGKSDSYIWANTDATRIGMNLKWIQVGLTEKADDKSFGFTVEKSPAAVVEIPALK